MGWADFKVHKGQLYTSAYVPRDTSLNVLHDANTTNVRDVPRDYGMQEKQQHTTHMYKTFTEI
jgi:hypothetical protein